MNRLTNRILKPFLTASLFPFISFSAVAAGPVAVGKDGFLQRDGKPIFVIGAYHFPKGWTYDHAAKAGFTLAHTSADPQDAGAAMKAGLHAWVSLGGKLELNGDAQSDAAKINTIRQAVDNLKDHPALLFWDSVDEPAWTDKNPALPRIAPEPLIRGREALRRLDPAHPVYLNHAPRNTVDTLRQYNTACDIVAADIYPILAPNAGKVPAFAITPDGRHGDLPNQQPSCVGEYVDKMRAVATDRHAAFIVLQGFAWEALRNPNEQNTDMIRYPTYVESRFMAFNAVIHRANGLMYWGLAYVPPDHAFLKDLAKVLREVNSLRDVITAETLPDRIEKSYAEMGSTITAGVETLIKRTDDAVYVLSANTAIDPARVTFSNWPVKAKKIEFVGESRTVTPTDGRFTETYPPLAVRIYRSPR